MSAVDNTTAIVEHLTIDAGTAELLKDMIVKTSIDITMNQKLIKSVIN